MGDTIPTTSLLKTKYSVPGRNKQLMPRHALARRLNDALCHKLTVISAPAGYGKTTAVLTWLETAQVPNAWLSIDEGDNDPLSFWRYVSAALDSILTGISRETEYVFSSPELFQSNLHINVLIDSLMNLSSDTVLVLDDLHLISNPSVYETLSLFITYLPSNMHLVLVSRSEPPMKLSRLGMKDELVRIGADDLRFGKEEISDYIRAKGYCLQENELELIESYTEGWAAALVAVILSLRGEASVRHAIRSFGSCDLQIEHYLSEDIFYMWTEQQRDFMEKTAILDRLCAPLCQSVTGYDGSLLLKELYEHNTFLEALDNDGVWFRYHHLFSDFLRKRLEKKEAAAIPALCGKAGEWLEANGHPEEAIEYYLRGGIHDKAIPLIELYGGIQMRSGEYLAVISWIDRLPPALAEENPMLLVCKAFCYAGSNNQSRSQEYLDKLSQLLKDGVDTAPDIYAAYLMVKSNQLLIHGDIKGSMEAISQASSCGIQNMMHTNYVDFNLYDISMYRTVYLSIIDFFRANPADFDAYISDYRTLISTYPGYLPLIKGEVCYECGDFAKAVPELAAAVEEAAQAGCPGALVPAMVTIAKIKRACGDRGGALETVEECEKIMVSYHKPHWVYMLRAFKTRLSIDEYNMEAVDCWVTESKLGVYHEITRTREFELIVYARALIKKQRYQDADILLNRLLSVSESLRRNHSIVEIVNLLAITAMKSLDEADAFLYIERALSIGMEEGYVRSFADEFTPMISLLELFIKKSRMRNKLTEYARSLLIITRKAAKDSMDFSQVPENESTLTPAEKKVLQFIVKGYTNQEISDELCIAIRTVTNHTVSIYKKMRVKNRTQCAQKAREYQWV